MASVKNLKQDINYVLGDVIEEVYSWELLHPDADTEKSTAIIDQAILSFDSLIAKVNEKNVDNRKSHFKAVKSDLEEVASELLGRVNKL